MASTYSQISFYIVAHADDWQLFMQPKAYYDLITPGSKVVFIITTAGDAGAGKDFWLAREEGCKSSIRFCLSPRYQLSEASGSREFEHHSISYWSLDNSTCYFLRLPDGNLDGSGFAAYNHQSLLKFKEGKIDAIAAIDHSANYNSCLDLCDTLQAIIIDEREHIIHASINYLNPDTTANPNDHKDHIITGELVQNMPIISTTKQTLYVGYSVGENQRTLSQTDLFWKAGMFAAYEKAVYDNGSYSTLHESIDTYINWCLREASFTTIHPQ